MHSPASALAPLRSASPFRFHCQLRCSACNLATEEGGFLLSLLGSSHQTRRAIRVPQTEAFGKLCQCRPRVVAAEQRRHFPPCCQRPNPHMFFGLHFVNVGDGCHHFVDRHGPHTTCQPAPRSFHFLRPPKRPSASRPVLHAGRQIGLGSSQEKVDVIWHPAVGDHVPRRALHFVSQTVCELPD